MILLWTLVIVIVSSLLFFSLRGTGARNNTGNPGNKQDKGEPTGPSSNLNQYSALRSFLEKSFAKKREAKTKFFINFIKLKEIFKGPNSPSH